MRRICVLTAVFVLAVSAHAYGQAPSRPMEMIHIDGSKNPELIPQWSAWQFTFEIISGGTRQIPFNVLKHLSEAEAALVLRAADEDAQTTADCEKRVLEMAPLLKTEKVKVLNEKVAALQLECRQRTLDTRDRLLPKLSDAARIALDQFVEFTKAGTKVSVPKKEFAHYLKPQ